MKNRIRRRKDRGFTDKSDTDKSSFINPFRSNAAPSTLDDEYGIAAKHSREVLHEKDNHGNVWHNYSNHLPKSQWPTFRLQSSEGSFKGNLISKLFDPQIGEGHLNSNMDEEQVIHMENIRCNKKDDSKTSSIYLDKDDYSTVKTEFSSQVTNESPHKLLKSAITATTWNKGASKLLEHPITYNKNILNINRNRMQQSDKLIHFRSNLGSMMDDNTEIQQQQNENALENEAKIELTQPFSSNQMESTLLSPGERQEVRYNDEDLLDLGSDPIKTSSGLLLTHRRVPVVQHVMPKSRPQYINEDSSSINNRISIKSIPNPISSGAIHTVDYGHPLDNRSDPNRKSAGNRISLELTAEREKHNVWLKHVRSWVYAFIILFVMGTVAAAVVIWKENNPSSPNNHGRRNGSTLTNSMISVSLNKTEPYNSNRNENLIETKQPSVMKNTTLFVSQKQTVKEGTIHRNLRRLREDFEEWMDHHSKSYKSEEEKMHRFQIWMDNHHRTIEKNEQHGPCKLTGKNVFGSNHFKDMTLDEFKKKHLTGYNGPRVENTSTKEETHGRRAQESRKRSDPMSHKDPKVVRKYMDAWATNYNGRKTGGYTSSTVSWTNIFSTCSYSMSCYLKFLFGSNYNREPAYDEESFPESVDWRNAGAVTSIHKQGSCGACWGITAVETIESAYFLKSGELLDLAETEPILCDDSCEMCYGGWPQNAYEYVMDHGGLPLESSVTYDGDALYLITMVLAGESDEVDGDYVTSYMNGICPKQGGNTNVVRYAEPSGYGYATERCLCYTSGEGCDCDDQDEAQAIANLASFGPSTMCLDASVWMDYEGGIITSESGCSQEFMDMNHCVQVVGYAFLEDDEDEEADDDDRSGSGSRKSGSRDFENREGYFIIRNQWSEYWGMNGYAYLAMGNGYKNTCGALNDITQVYFD